MAETLDTFLTFTNEQAPISAANETTRLRKVLLAPYGDWPNSRGLQRFTKEDANAIVSEFSNVVSRLAQPSSWLGLPWYEGHPDHPDFRGKPGHTRATAVGRIKSLEAGDDGLYANVKFNEDGERLIVNESYHGHSVNWFLSRDKVAANAYRPFRLKSVGFTNEPNIPVPAVTTANAWSDAARKAAAEKRGHTREGDEIEEGMMVRARKEYGGRVGKVTGWNDDKSFIKVKHGSEHASYHHSDLHTHDEEDANSSLPSRFQLMAAMRQLGANARLEEVMGNAGTSEGVKKSWNKRRSEAWGASEIASQASSKAFAGHGSHETAKMLHAEAAAKHNELASLHEPGTNRFEVHDSNARAHELAAAHHETFQNDFEQQNRSAEEFRQAAAMR